MHRRTTLTALAVAGSLLVASPASAALTWTVVPAPNPSAARNQFTAVSARTGSDAWAVGAFLAPDADDDGLQMLTARWDGTRWQQVPAPAVLHQDESLQAVSASSASDAWAVGFTKTVSAAARSPLAIHWNGTAWTIVPTPATTGSAKAMLNGAAALSPSNAWAVGRGKDGRALAEHWDGTAWSIVSLPSPPVPPGSTLASSALAGISALSPTDIWAVGSFSLVTGTTVQGKTLAYHYDGTTWQVRATPNTAAPTVLNGVTAVATNNVWAVGNNFKTDGTGLPDVPVIQHWNGTAWSIVPSPAVPVEDTLSGVAARSATDVWAVGNSTDRTAAIPVARTLTLHWNGTAWSVVAGPNGPTGDTLLTGTSATPGGGDVWAVGFNLGTDSVYKTFVLCNTP